MFQARCSLLRIGSVHRYSHQLKPFCSLATQQLATRYGSLPSLCCFFWRFRHRNAHLRAISTGVLEYALPLTSCMGENCRKALSCAVRLHHGQSRTARAHAHDRRFLSGYGPVNTSARSLGGSFQFNRAFLIWSLEFEGWTYFPERDCITAHGLHSLFRKRPFLAAYFCLPVPLQLHVLACCKVGGGAIDMPLLRFSLGLVTAEGRQRQLGCCVLFQ